MLLRPDAMRCAAPHCSCHSSTPASRPLLPAWHSLLATCRCLCSPARPLSRPTAHHPTALPSASLRPAPAVRRSWRRSGPPKWRLRSLTSTSPTISTHSPPQTSTWRMHRSHRWAHSRQRCRPAPRAPHWASTLPDALSRQDSRPVHAAACIACSIDSIHAVFGLPAVPRCACSAWCGTTTTSSMAGAPTSQPCRPALSSRWVVWQQGAQWSLQLQLHTPHMCTHFSKRLQAPRACCAGHLQGGAPLPLAVPAAHHRRLQPPGPGVPGSQRRLVSFFYPMGAPRSFCHFPLLAGCCHPPGSCCCSSAGLGRLPLLPLLALAHPCLPLLTPLLFLLSSLQRLPFPQVDGATGEGAQLPAGRQAGLAGTGCSQSFPPGGDRRDCLHRPPHCTAGGSAGD